MATDKQKSLSQALTLGNTLRERVSKGKAIGTFLIEYPVSSTVFAVANAGFDFIVLDMEHSNIGFEKLEALILAAQVAQLPAIVRPWSSDAGLIGKILDLGANGIMVPHVDTVEQAKRVIQSCRYGKDGGRGYSPLTKFSSLETPIQTLVQSTFVILQLEGQEAISEAQAISQIPGLDALFVGPYDLALSMDVVPGDPAVYAAAKQVAQQCSGNVILGLYLDNPASSDKCADDNFKLQCISFDGQMFAAGAASVMRRLGEKKPQD